MVPGEKKYSTTGVSIKLNNLQKLLLRHTSKNTNLCNCAQDEHAGEDTDEINTKSLKVFISKRKWQVSHSLCHSLKPKPLGVKGNTNCFLVMLIILNMISVFSIFIIYLSSVP